MPRPRLAVWGSELSPFSLKLRALLAHARVPYDWLPADGSRLQNLRAMLRVDRAKRQRTAIRYPETTPLDEYPLVPYLLTGDRVYYDSSAIARWLDHHTPRGAGPLVPADPLLAFVARVLDEAWDEVGLYVVHHHRWVTSAATNDAGARLAREFRRVLPPLAGRRFARRFAERQVRRLPYLFSVAPEGFEASVRAALVPPSRAGFPETHALLEAIWTQWVDGVEQALGARPYLFGARFTLADASVYGELAMNLDDPTIAARMRERIPTTVAWLERIRRGEHAEAPPEGDGDEALALHDALRPLLAAVGRVFVPLMRQNARAYEAARAAGETLFNEAAFDQGRALYDGELLGRPFRSVAKTFQVRVWREVQAAWGALAPDAQRTACELFEARFDQATAPAGDGARA